MNDLFSVGREVSEYISKLVNYIDKIFEYTDKPGDEIPEKLEAIYIKNHNNAEDAASRSRKLLLEMRDTQIQYDFDEEFDSELNKYLNICEEFVRAIAELLSTLERIVSIEGEGLEVHVVTKDSIEWDVDLRVTKDEFEDCVDDLSNSKGDFQQAVNNYIR